MKFPKVKMDEDGLQVDERTPLVRYNKAGEQILDDTPIEVPVGWNAPETMAQMIARLVRVEVSRSAVDAGFESLDEAYDFDTPEGDEYEEHLTPAELHAMMHAPEMKEERPLKSRNQESDNVRERTGSGSESSEDSADGVRDGNARVSRGGAEKYARDSKGNGRKNEALRVRGGSDAGGNSGAGGSGVSAGTSSDE